MGVAVLQPRDCLTRNIHNKPTPNRRRRSPPRHQPTTSSPPPPESSSFIPKGSKKKNLNHNNINNVRILKRGEDLTVENKPDLRSNRPIGSDPMMIPSQNRKTNHHQALFYAGTVTSTSPPPSEVPLPGFFAKKSSVFKPSDATNDLIRILRLDIA